MKTAALCLALLVGAYSVAAQKTGRRQAAPPAALTLPLTADQWTFKEEKVEFVEHRGVRAMRIQREAGTVAAKNLTFADGTIEYDVELLPTTLFASTYFRRKDDKTQEIFYLRNRVNKPLFNDAIQYAPYVDGVNLWDLFDAYQAPALLKADGWNHVKLVVSGLQMRVYVNDMNRPALEIPQLEADVREGGLAFDGQCVIANVVVRPGETGGLAPYAGTDLTNHDARYLRKWQVSEPVTLPPGQELTVASLPKADARFQPIKAERRGLVNLTRKYGDSQRQRRYVWLKARIASDKARSPLLRLGFSDEVWVFVNGQPVFVDKNLYGQNMRKMPDGRISIENASFPLPLKEGDNEVLVGLANDFFGWGLMARLDSMEGLQPAP